MTETNPILATDFYKCCHPSMLPEGNTGAFAYLEPRGGEFDTVCFFGLQAFIKERLSKPITEADVKDAAEFCKSIGAPFPYEGWMRVVTKHGGFLPLRIRAIAEGSVVPVGNAVMTVESTDPELPWLTGWMETALLRATWYPSTIATAGFHLKKALYRLVAETCENPDAEIVNKVSEFGARGVSSGESAAIGGAAHLVNFRKTATLEGIRFASKNYGSKGPIASGLPSIEHSVTMTWGQEREAECYAHVLATYAKPGKGVSIVSDTYDYWKTVFTMWMDPKHPINRQIKAAGDAGAMIAIRPDSGEPIGTTVATLNALHEGFGATKNAKGYWVIDSNVRVIWGDGLTPTTLLALAEAVKAAGYSLTNVFFGMGGGMLQQVHRDQMKWAYKVSAVQANGTWHGVKKTAHGKESKAGRLALVRAHGQFRTVPENTAAVLGKEGMGFEHLDANRANLLRIVYENGHIGSGWTFDDVRINAADALVDALKEV